MIFENRDFTWCINWCANGGYTIEVIPESKFTGNLKMIVTDYVDAAKEVVYTKDILYFHNWKCVKCERG